MEIGKYIDHTNLKMDATSKDIAKLCREAIEYGFETVCVNPCYVPLAKDKIQTLEYVPSSVFRLVPQPLK